MEFVADVEERLDKFLARVVDGRSRTALARLIEAGQVSVDGDLADKARLELRPGQRVTIVGDLPRDPHHLEPANIRLDVPYEDESLLVVVKPRGLATHPAPGLLKATLVNALLGRAQPLSQGTASYRPGIVHRLDRDTTGLLLIAKDDEAHASLAHQISTKVVSRHYAAIVRGRPDQNAFTVDAPIGRDARDRRKMALTESGKASLTHVRVLRSLGEGTLVVCRLETGRTHQIRVHLAGCGLPVKGDRIYAQPPWSSGPLQLHAAWLSFRHPRTDAPISVYAPPPPDFEAEVAQDDVDTWN